MPNCTFCGGNDEFFFLFLDLSAFPKKTTPGKFALICHFQLIEINATDFEEKQIHFKFDVFAAVAFVDSSRASANLTPLVDSLWIPSQKVDSLN